jgi:hypothetical protein
VTLRPKKLKNAMLKATTTPDHKTGGLSTIWCQPRGRSKKVEREAHVARKGMKSNDGGCPKETFETDSIEGVMEYFSMICFFDDELGGSADNGSSAGENQ